MASDERDGDGGAGKPPPLSPEGAAAARVQPEQTPLELSSRGRIVVRSSSHPPGETPPYSDPPTESTPPTGRIKRDTPAERPRGRRAARAMSTSADGAVHPSQPAGAPGRATTLLWAIIVALSAALAYALMR